MQLRISVSFLQHIDPGPRDSKLKSNYQFKIGRLSHLAQQSWQPDRSRDTHCSTTASAGLSIRKTFDIHSEVRCVEFDGLLILFRQLQRKNVWSGC